MSDKERILQALKGKNYFEHAKKDSLEVLVQADKLEDVIIEVERSCNVDKLLFRYDPETRKFCRVTPRQKDVELLDREMKYRMDIECTHRNCLRRKIDFEDFIKLLDFALEPIGVYRLCDFQA